MNAGMGDVDGGLFADLAEDDLGLGGQRRTGAVLEEEDERRRAEHRRDGEHHWMRAPDALNDLHRVVLPGR